jgi:serine/threonine protein kinase
VIALESTFVLHRDIAARNFLVTDKLEVLLSDFGMAVPLANKDAIYYGDDFSLFRIKWCAPEVLKFGQFSLASDRYALGITLWEIFTKRKRC